MRYLKWFINTIFTVAFLLVTINVYTYYISAEISSIDNVLDIDAKITKKSVYIPLLLNMHVYQNDNSSLISTVFDSKLIFELMSGGYSSEDLGMAGVISQITNKKFRKNRFTPLYTLYFDNDPEDINGQDTIILNVNYNLTDKTVNNINERIVKNKEVWNTFLADDINSISYDLGDKAADKESDKLYKVTFNEPLTILEVYNRLLFILNNDHDNQFKQEQNFMQSLARDRGYSLHKNDTWLIGYTFLNADKQPNEEQYVTAVAISYNKKHRTEKYQGNETVFYQRKSNQ